MTAYKKLFIILFLFEFSLQSYCQQPSGKDSVQGLINDKKALRFIVFGDWGRNGEYKQREVASEMGVIGKEIKAEFIVSTGDNFYPNGVRSVLDHNWISSFENVYTAHSLQTDWYVVLGNHDYKGEPQAEIEYSKIDRRWNMPARYYSKRIPIHGDSTQEVLLIFLDTTPFLSEYYKDDEHHVKGVDTAAQRIWLEKELSDNSPSIKWKLVFGHHALYSGGSRMNNAETKEITSKLKPIFDRYKVDAYICGHEHSLQYMKPPGNTHYFISGAGSETTDASLYPDIGKFALSENGFVVFSITTTSLTSQFISYTGKILYTNTINK